MLVLGKSHAIIINNNIKNNDGIGLFIKDTSYGEIRDNRVNLIIQIVYNELEMVLEKKHPNHKLLLISNIVDGEIRRPSNSMCILF